MGCTLNKYSTHTTLTPFNNASQNSHIIDISCDESNKCWWSIAHNVLIKVLDSEYEKQVNNIFVVNGFNVHIVRQMMTKLGTCLIVYRQPFRYGGATQRYISSNFIEWHRMSQSLWQEVSWSTLDYRQTSNVSRTLVGSQIVDWWAPVGAAPTTSSFLT